MPCLKFTTTRPAAVAGTCESRSSSSKDGSVAEFHSGVCLVTKLETQRRSIKFRTSNSLVGSVSECIRKQALIKTIEGLLSQNDTKPCCEGDPGGRGRKGGGASRAANKAERDR